MYDTTTFSYACYNINRAFSGRGPKFHQFMDYSPKQVKHAVKSFIRDPEITEYSHHTMFLDASGVMRTGKKGFALSNTKLYSDRFVGNPVVFENIESVKREGADLTFFMADGSSRKENCGEYARYLECIFRYGLFFDLKTHAKITLKDEEKVKEYAELELWVLDFAGRNCTWEEYLEEKEEEKRAGFVAAKMEAEKGEYDVICMLCKEHDAYFESEEERYEWNKKALNAWTPYDSEKPDFEILANLVQCARRANQWRQEFVYGNLLMRYYGKEGYAFFHETDISHSYELLCEEANPSSGNEFAAELKNDYQAAVWASKDWLDAEKQNQQDRDMERDAEMRTYQTWDDSLIEQFKKLEKESYTDEAIAFYQEQAEQGNAYAMYMISENHMDSKVMLEYLEKAVELDYPPALYEYGRRLIDKNHGYADFYSPATGYMLLKRAAARRYGRAALDLISFIRDGEIDDLTLEKLLEYAKGSYASKDYNGARACAVIKELLGEEDYQSYYERAAELGDVESAGLLAEFYGNQEEYGEEQKWNKLVIRNSRLRNLPVDDAVVARGVCVAATGLGVTKDEYKAFQTLIEGLEYKYNDHNGELLEFCEQYNPEIKELLAHMAQKVKDGEERASRLWKFFERACKGPLVESPRTIEDYLE